MRDLNRWNPEAWTLLATAVVSFLGFLISGSHRFMPGVLACLAIQAGTFVWMLTYFHRATQQRFSRK